MIIDLQRRIAEIGRIRIGQQVPVSNGSKKTRPAKLTTFRLTSPDRTRIHQAATLYGGTPTEWQAPSGNQWEIITEADTLNVIVPPGDMAFSQHYELWSGGGCQRRCDGQYETISDQTCICDPEQRECAIHTRLSVMLRDLPGLGVWRIDTQGYYAAVELQGAVEVVQMAAGAGRMLPAKLRLEQRMIKRANEGVKRFAVPVLDIEVSPAQLFAGGAGLMIDGTPGTVSIEPPRQAALTPVPESVPSEPVASIAEQAGPPAQRPRRSNAAQSVPRTGIAPRTAAQAARCEEPPPPPPDEPSPDDGRRRTDLATAAQNRKMHACFRDHQLTDRDDRLTVTAHILGHPVDTSSALAISEASAVIDTLQNWSAGRDNDGQPVDASALIRDILNTATIAAEGVGEQATLDEPAVTE